MWAATQPISQQQVSERMHLLPSPFALRPSFPCPYLAAANLEAPVGQFGDSHRPIHSIAGTKRRTDSTGSLVSPVIRCRTHPREDVWARGEVVGGQWGRRDVGSGEGGGGGG